MRGGVTEVSSAMPVGLYNSRPSTRLGLALGTAKAFNSSSGVLGWPISRVGTVFRVICARPAVAQKRAAMIERDFLDSMERPMRRDAESPPYLGYQTRTTPRTP